MDYGVVMFATEYAIPPDELARALEERGFESVWFPEHTHIPAKRRSPWPGGGDLPRDYWSSYDPFITHGGGRAHAAPQARHRHLPGRQARSDHHGQGGRDPRPAVGRPLPVRHRRG